MFVAARLRLRCRAPLHIDAVSARQAYGAVNALVGAVDSQAAALAHTAQGFLGTSGPLIDGLPPLSTAHLDAGDEFTLQVSAAGEPIHEALLQALARGSVSLVLGPDDSRIGPLVTCDVVESLLEGDSSLGPITFRSLCERATSEADGPMRVTFISPTSFKRRKTWLALPAPEQVFGDVSAEPPRGLAGKWEAMGGPPLPPSFSGAVLGCTPVEVSPCTVRTHTSQRGDPAPVRGFMGACDYYATASETRAAMWALGLFAEFVGVGAGPAMGLGRVKVERAR